MFTKCYTHIIMVAMVTYFFPNFFVKYEHFSNRTHFFLLLFLKQEFFKISGILLFIATTETL